MPTGYTAAVMDGKVTELKDYAIACSRAFGALFSMRDCPLDTPIPERFEPDTKYYDEDIEHYTAELEELNSLSDEELVERFNKENAAIVERINEAIERNRLIKERYEAMLEKVNAWSVPEELTSLKKMMIEQLTSSLSFDVSDEPAKYIEIFASVEEYKKTMVDHLTYSIESSKQNRDHAIKRCEEDNEWLCLLREALK